MTNSTLGIKNNKKLVKGRPVSSHGATVRKSSCTNKLAKPRIESHTVKGNDYYYYRRGVDRPVYLGTADSILKKVKG